jgi:hypothetical protein
MRNIVLYTLCMFKQPTSIKSLKRVKINYERIRDNYVKKHRDEIPEQDLNTL